MADYNAIKGKLVQSLSSDPSITSAYEGQVWYNSTTSSLKGLVQIKAWSSGGNTNTGGYGAGGAGTQTAGLIFGRTAPVTGATEEYNGFAWSEQNDLNTARRYAAGFGTQTAAVASGGNGTAKTADSEEYDGSSWSEGNNLNTARQGAAGAGTLTAGLVFGGSDPSPANTGVTETYDGTSYAEVNDLNTVRRFLGGCGTQTAALAFGGNSTAIIANNESWNGTSWTEVGNLNNVKASGGSAGTQTHALYFGGNPGNNATSEEWDGTSWTSTPSMATGRGYLAGAGTASAAFGATGYISGTPTPGRVQTEEYFSDLANFSASQAPVWTSGGNLGAGRYQMNGQNVGTKDAGLCIGGQGSFPSTAPAVTVSSVEEYDGSSWSEVNNTPTTLAMTGSVGVQTAALQFGGYGKPGGGPNPGPSSPNFSASNHYDGTNWTSGGSLPSSVAYLTGAGTQTAAVSIGGYNASTTCNLYNGSTWTATGSMTTGRHNGSAVGISTAALIIGGAPVPGGVANDVEEFNGSTWSSSPDLPTNREQASVGGTTASAYAGHGNQPGTNVLTLDWNGTAWSSGVNASTYRYGGVSGGTSTTGGYFAGGGGSAEGTQRQSTEEYTFGAIASPTGITASKITTS